MEGSLEVLDELTRLDRGARDHVGDGELLGHDLHASPLHQLGIDHERFTFRHQGRELRLTDVEGRVVRALLA